MTSNTIIIIMLVVLLFLTIYVGIRNDYVAAFRIYLIEASFKWLIYDSEQLSEETSDEIYQKKRDAILEHKEQVMAILNKYSYDDMLFSFIPLKPEAWYTDEEICTLGLWRVDLEGWHNSVNKH